MEIDLEWEHLSIPRYFVVATIAYVCENFFVYPLFVIKTKEQISSSKSTRHFGAGKEIFKDVMRNKGISGLYRGFGFACTAGLPSIHTYMLVYHYSKYKLVQDNSAASQFVAPMISGALAEAISLYLYVPVDIVTQRMQLEANRTKTARQIALEAYKQEGIRGLYRGLTITVVTLGIGSATWWVCYEQCKQILSTVPPTVFHKPVRAENDMEATSQPQEYSLAKGPNLSTIFAGIVAGSTALTMSQPFDVVKTRIQTTPRELQVARGYHNMVTGFMTIYRSEGIRGFLRGLPSKVLGRVPINAVAAVIYEAMLHWSVKQ